MRVCLHQLLAASDEPLEAWGLAPNCAIKSHVVQGEGRTASKRVCPKRPLSAILATYLAIALLSKTPPWGVSSVGTFGVHMKFYWGHSFSHYGRLHEAV